MEKKMVKTLAFDVYGTLIDTHGVVAELQKLVGDRAMVFSELWRGKQLEYSFRRGLMRNYKNFGQCTSDALEYSCLVFGCEFTKEQKQQLLDIYKVLPVFLDVRDALETLKNMDYRLYAFSNGTQEAVKNLLINADIDNYFIDIVSVDEVSTFKPNPDVYQHFLRRAGSMPDDTWLISSNAFDVTGAISAGLKSAWIKRSANAVFDPWDISPTITVSGLVELEEQLSQHQI